MIMIKMEEFFTKSANRIDIEEVVELISNIDTCIEHYMENMNYSHICITLTKEYNLTSLNEVARKYKNEGGWYKVAYKIYSSSDFSFSENNEKRDVIEFNLFTKQMYNDWVRKIIEENIEKYNMF